MKNEHPKNACAALIAALMLAMPAAYGAHHEGGAVDAQELKREWAQAAEALRGYSAAQREKALAKGREALDALDARIQKLEARAESEWGRVNRSAQQQRSAALRALRRQRNETAEWYGRMRQSSESAWGEVRRGFVDAYGSLTNAFEKAAAEFKTGEDAKKP